MEAVEGERRGTEGEPMRTVPAAGNMRSVSWMTAVV